MDLDQKMDNQIESMIEKTPFVVGMALKKEKAKKHLSQKLIDRATQHGILLKVIDEYVPLAEQGHFDVILQKIRRRGALWIYWESEGGNFLNRNVSFFHSSKQF